MGLHICIDSLVKSINLNKKPFNMIMISSYKYKNKIRYLFK